MCVREHVHFFSNFGDLPDQPGCGEIGERVRAPGAPAVALYRSVSGSKRKLYSRELVDGGMRQMRII